MRRMLTPALLAALLLFTPLRSVAMWEELTDSQLCAQSDVIVEAEYLGQTRVDVASTAKSVWLGVLKVEAVLKGDSRQSVILLAVPSPEGPRSSSDIVFKSGQKGLWFLSARSADDSGIYAIDHPRRFVDAARVGDRKDAIRAILDAQNAGQ